MSLREIFRLVLGWRFLLVAIAIPAMFLLTPRTRFTGITENPTIGNVFTMWSNFDGRHYLDLAQYGYGYQHKTDMDYAFFPVYPWSIRTFSLFGNYLASGLVISHLTLMVALYFLYKLVVMDFKSKVARSTIYLILFFPTAFFFGSVYTESLFLMLSVLSFYCARKNNFFLACLFAGIASATKVTGIFLWPALIYEYWVFNKKSLSRAIQPVAIWLILPPLGLLAYLKYQLVQTGDPFFFITYQTNFTGRTIEKLVLLHQVFFRYAKMVVFVNHTDPLFFTVLLELLCASLTLVVLVFSFKTIRRSYWIFSFLSFILPTFTGTFASVPRYVVTLFPVFIHLAFWFEKQHPYFKYAYYALSVIFTIISVILFTRGYFIA